MFRKILIGFGLLVVVLFLFANFALEGIIKNKLQSMIESTFEDYYTLTFNSNYSSLDLSGFSIGFEGVKLSSDTTDKAMSARFAPIFFEAKTFEVKNISITSLLLKSDIDIGSFELHAPELLFLIDAGEAAQPANSADETKNFISELEIAEFELIGGSAAFIYADTPSDTLYAGQDLDVTFDALRILIDNAGIDAKDIQLDQVNIQLKNVRYNPKTSAYKYQMTEMKLDYKQQQLICNALNLVPKKTLYEMTLNEQYQKTKFDIVIDQFELGGIDFEKLKDQGFLEAKLGHLKKSKFTLLRNANHSLAPNKKLLMNQALVQSKIPIRLDSLVIEDAFIDYSIIPKGKTEVGKVQLANINGYLAGLNSAPTKGDTLELYIESRFMDNGQLTFAAEFPLTNVPFNSYHGHISQLPFTDLNAIVRPLVNVQMNKGMIEDIYFTGICSDTATTGQMIFDYDQLKFQVNKKETGKKRWLISKVGNLIVKHHSTKTKGARSKAIDYSYTRPPYQGHIGFYLNGLLDGMMKNLLPKSIYESAVKEIRPKSDLH